MFKTRDSVFLAAMFLVAALLRLLAFGWGGAISHDGAAYYLKNARALLDGGFGNWDGMSLAVPPLYPYLAAALARVIGDLEFAGALISIVAGAACVFPAFRIARILFPERVLVPRLTALLTAISPYAVRLGGDARGDALYALLFLCAVIPAYRLAVQPSRRNGAMFGLLVGLAYLVRPEALGLIGFTALGCALRIWIARRAPHTGNETTASVRKYGLPFLCVFFALAPSVGSNMLLAHQKLGLWTLSVKAGILLDVEKGFEEDPFRRLNAAKTMTLHEEKLTNPAAYREFAPFEVWQSAPGTMLGAYASNFGALFSYFPGVLGYLATLLFVAGLPGVWRERHTRRALLLVSALVIFYALAFALFYVTRRHWLAFLPLFYPFAALGFEVLLGLCQAARGKQLAFAVTLLLAGVLPQTTHRWFGEQWRTSPERRIGERLLAAHGAGQTCTSNKGQVEFYARATHFFAPNAPLDDVIAYMRNRGIRFLIFDIPARWVADPTAPPAGATGTTGAPRHLWAQAAASAHFKLIDEEVYPSHLLRIFERVD